MTEPAYQARRRAINRHLHRRHGGYAAKGSTEERVLVHLSLHEGSECDHQHFDWSPEALEEMTDGD